MANIDTRSNITLEEISVMKIMELAKVIENYENNLKMSGI